MKFNIDEVFCLVVVDPKRPKMYGHPEKKVDNQLLKKLLKDENNVRYATVKSLTIDESRYQDIYNPEKEYLEYNPEQKQTEEVAYLVLPLTKVPEMLNHNNKLSKIIKSKESIKSKQLSKHHLELKQSLYDHYYNQ